MKRIVTRLTICSSTAVDRAKWSHAANLGAQGRYAAATRILTVLMDSPNPTTRALGLTCRASQLRQIGDHAASLRLDEEAFVSLGRAGDRRGDAWSDAVTNLIADAVGLGELALASSRLEVAQGEVNGWSTWRTRTRLAWVQAEVALLRGEPGDGAAVLRALQDSGDPNVSARHRIKTSMLLAVCDRAGGVGGPAGGVDLLEQALRESATLGLRSLVWPTAKVLSEIPAALRTIPDAAVRRALHSAVDVVIDNLDQVSGDEFRRRLGVQPADLSDLS